MDTEYTEDDFAEGALPPAPSPRRDRDLAAVALMAVAVVGIIGTLFTFDLRLGALALFVGIGAVGVALGMSNASTSPRQ